jgi:hypothetical protein
MPLPPDPALGSLPSVALSSGHKQINICLLNGNKNDHRRGFEKALFKAKGTQHKLEIGAAPLRCKSIGYHLKLDSFLS